VILLALAIGLVMYIAAVGNLINGKSLRFYFIAEYCSDILMVVFLLIWGWTLSRLYADIEKSRDVKNILPNEGIFKLHATLLVIFFILLIAATITN